MAPKKKGSGQTYTSATSGGGTGAAAKASGQTYTSAASGGGTVPAAKASDGTEFASASSDKPENFIKKWITVAKAKREEFILSQPIRQPLQITERDPDYRGEQIKRKCTDKFGILFIAVLVITWIVFLSYCFHYSDVGRIKNGFDSCGNVCGKPPDCAKRSYDRMRSGSDCEKRCHSITKNHKLVEFEKTNQIVYDPDEINKTCVDSCSPGFIQILSKCIPFKGTEIGNTIFHLIGYEKIAQEIAEDICLAWPYIAIAVLISAGLCMLVLPALRYLPLFSIWTVLVATVVSTLGSSVYSWHKYVDASSLRKVDEEGRDQKYTYLFASIGSTIAAINAVILMVAMKPKIKWVAELFVECAKAKISLPRLILVPLSTFFLVSGLFSFGCYCLIMVESAGHLHYGDTTVTLEKDFIMKFTKWYHLLVSVVLVFFVMGIQDYVVASSVVYLFFTRGKKQLGYPVFRSIRNAFRYHIGSIAMYSAITKINAAIAGISSKFIFKLSVAGPGTITRVFGCCCACLYKEVCKFVVGLSERSYVTMSMYGMSFLESGREGYLITFENRSSLNQVLRAGRHLILFVKVLNLVVGYLIGHLLYLQLNRIQHLGFLVFFTMILVYICCNCFISVFEMTLTALMISYCVDVKLNDGVDKPYYMSPELLVFVKEACLDCNLQEVTVDDNNIDYRSATSR